MEEFKFKVVRIEAVTLDPQGEQVRVTFQVDCGLSSFQIPVLLSMKDFDDTEMVQAARNALHKTFVELAAQSEKWKLTRRELQQLSSISSRPKA
jgi:hypothetical protein